MLKKIWILIKGSPQVGIRGDFQIWIPIPALATPLLRLLYRDVVVRYVRVPVSPFPPKVSKLCIKAVTCAS